MIDRAKVDAVFAAAGIQRRGIYAFSVERAGDDVTAYSRMLPSGGIEDPATGSAVGPAGCFAAKYGFVPRERIGAMMFLQGVLAKRPSRLHVKVAMTGAEVTQRPSRRGVGRRWRRLDGGVAAAGHARHQLVAQLSDGGLFIGVQRVAFDLLECRERLLYACYVSTRRRFIAGPSLCSTVEFPFGCGTDGAAYRRLHRDVCAGRDGQGRV